VLGHDALFPVGSPLTNWCCRLHGVDGKVLRMVELNDRRLPVAVTFDFSHGCVLNDVMSFLGDSVCSAGYKFRSHSQPRPQE
jgi:hypothetical protein